MKKWISLLGIGFLGLGIFVVHSWSTQPTPSGIVPARVISPRQPAYLETPIPRNTVLLEVTVNPEGEMDDVRVLRDYSGQSKTALREIQSWKFSPAMIEGKPIRSTIPVEVPVG